MNQGNIRTSDWLEIPVHRSTEIIIFCGGHLENKVSTDHAPTILAQLMTRNMIIAECQHVTNYVRILLLECVNSSCNTVLFNGYLL